MPSQRAFMRALVERFGFNEERIVEEYAAAEMRGEVKRESNKYGMTPEVYARGLLREGIRKGWISGAGVAKKDGRLV
jgi:hypothetical protein